MNIIAKQGDILKEKADLVVFGLFSGVQNFAGALKAADKALEGYATDAVTEEDFSGKTGEICVVHTHGKLPANRLAIVGLGDKKTFNDEAVRRAIGSVVRYAEKIEAKKICVAGWAWPDASSAGQAFCEGALLADYAFLNYLPAKNKKRAKRGLVELTVIEESATVAKTFQKGIVLGEISSRATIYVRDLVNEPASKLTPSHFLEHAQLVAKSSPNIKLSVLDKDACAKLGMGAFLGVAKGSDEAPYFLHLVYRPNGAKAQDTKLKKIALIGKGVTFDSGGLSLKPSNAMETMKCDMSGAAAVLGVFSVLADAEPNAEIHGLTAVCENMINGKAMRPGDIVTAMNGKTIEVLNTDAEGRLTLADALSFADKKIKPDVVIDLATLTGACMVALGDAVAGLMGNDDKLIKQISESAEAAGEAVWPLPLPSDYAALVVGDHTDLRNISRGKYGGALTAGLFLQEFVPENAAWAHLDIAGPSFAERELSPYSVKGGTGFGVRTLLNWLKRF